MAILHLYSGGDSNEALAELSRDPKIWEISQIREISENCTEILWWSLTLVMTIVEPSSAGGNGRSLLCWRQYGSPSLCAVLYKCALPWLFHAWRLIAV